MPLRGLSSTVSVVGRMIGASSMNRQVTFNNPGIRDVTNGSYGEPSAAFSTWAAIYAVAGDELDKVRQIAQKVSHIVVIPYQLNVQENMTIDYIDGGTTRTFQIAAIDDQDEQRWFLKIFAFEMGQNAGGSS